MQREQGQVASTQPEQEQELELRMTRPSSRPSWRPCFLLELARLMVLGPVWLPVLWSGREQQSLASSRSILGKQMVLELVLCSSLVQAQSWIASHSSL